MHTKSDSDLTSLAPSSPTRSPKRALYYVQSPSRDSNDGDKSASSIQATPVYNSPMESPSHSSFGPHSRPSSASRFSGNLRWSSGRRGYNGRRRSEGKCGVIEEEVGYGEKGVSRRCQCFVGLVGLVGLVLVFGLFCLILWGASRPYNAKISVESLTVHNFYFGEGSDPTGVPTKMVTVNCTLKMRVYNPATFFGIHVSSSPVNLMYAEIAVATGQLNKYYQPRKSHRTAFVKLGGNKVPLYGAGASFAMSEKSSGIPLVLVFEVRSQGNVVGKLVSSKHRRHASCSLLYDSGNNKAIKFKENSCTYG